MINRCEYEPDRTYAYYGGRGIRVCEKWRTDYLAFKADVGEPPSSEHTLDRIDNDGHYEPGNVRWATRLQQANNKSNNRAKRGLPPDRRKEKRDAERSHS